MADLTNSLILKRVSKYFSISASDLQISKSRLQSHPKRFSQSPLSPPDAKNRINLSARKPLQRILVRKKYM